MPVLHACCRFAAYGDELDWIYFALRFFNKAIGDG